MALIKCNECGKEISDEARTCPNCGKTIWGKNDKIWSNIVCICAIITGIGWFIGAYVVDLDRKHFSYQFTFVIIGILCILFGFWYMYHYHKKANEMLNKNKIATKGTETNTIFEKHKTLLISLFSIIIMLILSFFMNIKGSIIIPLIIVVVIVLMVITKKK